MAKKIKSINFFYRPGNGRAEAWEKKITAWLKKNFPAVGTTGNPQAVLVLGGDGTILEAARKYQGSPTAIFGLNLGQVGFLAAARDEREFLPAIKKLVSGDYSLVDRTMIETTVTRKNERVFRTYALNDVVIENPLGMVRIEADIAGSPFQTIQGTGVLVATATGSTAYNLSAHGPIVSPDIDCLIITEILDHNIPTPSIVIKTDEKINFRIVSFRERGLLSVTKSSEKVEVMLVADGEAIFPLIRKDLVTVAVSPKSVRFAEIEKNYFIKSLREKFAFE